MGENWGRNSYEDFWGEVMFKREKDRNREKAMLQKYSNLRCLPETHAYACAVLLYTFTM